MGGTSPGRLCPRHLIVGGLKAVQENCAVHRFLGHPIALTDLALRWRCQKGAQRRSDRAGFRFGLAAEPQQRHNVDFARLLSRPTATRSATAAATHPVAQRNGGREREQHRIWGEHPRRRYLSLAIGGQAGVNPTRRTVNKMSVAPMSSLALASSTYPAGRPLARRLSRRFRRSFPARPVLTQTYVRTFPEEPFAGAGPMVRIRFPPAVSLRTIGS
jgi:hypothetical protein